MCDDYFISDVRQPHSSGYTSSRSCKPKAKNQFQLTANKLTGRIVHVQLERT